MKMFGVSTILVGALLIAQSARSSDMSVPTVTGHFIHGEAFDDGPRTRAVLLPGMGRVDFPVTTTQPEAQAFINQQATHIPSSTLVGPNGEVRWSRVSADPFLDIALLKAETRRIGGPRL